MREDQIVAAAVNLEDRAEELLGHRRAFDMPARATRPPGRFPNGVLALLVRLPEREVARVLLQLIAFCLLGRIVQSLVIPLAAGEAAVFGEPRDTEIDVAAGRICELAVDEPADQVDDLQIGRASCRERV